MVGSVHVFTGIRGKSTERLYESPAKTSRLLDVMRTPQSPRGQFACRELGCRSVEGTTLRFPSPCWRWHSLGPTRRRCRVLPRTARGQDGRRGARPYGGAGRKGGSKLHTVPPYNKGAQFLSKDASCLPGTRMETAIPQIFAQ